MKKIILTVWLVLFVTLLYPSAGKTFDPAAVDKVFEEWNKPGSPGCALAVVKDGKIIYKKGYGLANLELDVPITPQTVFYIGSVSKQFVAFAVALLEARGKLDFDDDIRKYVPEMPDYGTTITIRNLIHHTSGIRGYLMLLDMAGLDLGFYHKAEDVINNVIARQKNLNFKPGEKYQYSNSGYLILADIVRRVSGKSFRQFVHENIFKPLGMKNSRFHDNYKELIKNRATSYLTSKGEYVNFMSTFDLVGSGGLYTTVEDLFLWDQNFYHYKVGGPELFKTIHTKGKLNNGEETNYAFALMHGNYKGLKTVEHSGGLGGYVSVLMRFPGQEFSVIILANAGNFNQQRFAHRVADIFLADQFKPKPKEKKKKK
ncbi:MAG: serine hydrolase, partial [bacterium]|nr:serine hydrolase [bacterium]